MSGPSRSPDSADVAADSGQARPVLARLNVPVQFETQFETTALRRGVIQEWFGAGDTPPLLILTHLARRGLETAPAGHRHLVWIGRRVWPHPHVLVTTSGSLLACSVFVDPPEDASRLWAIDVAVTCPSVAAVVADGRGLGMTHSRRLQLAARRGGALVLLARPPRERHALSAASLRWAVQHVPARARTGTRAVTNDPTPNMSDRAPAPRWLVQRLRCKGAQRDRWRHGDAAPATEAARLLQQPQWILEWDRASGGIRVSADVADRSDQSDHAAALPRSG